MSKVVKCVFSLSKRAKRFEDEDIEGVVKWLKTSERGERPYFFSKGKPMERLPSGSIVLFSFEAQIFGKATVKEDKNQDEYSMVFDSRTVEIFPKPYYTKNDLKPILHPEKKGFGQLFTYLTERQYGKILELIREGKKED